MADSAWPFGKNGLRMNRQAITKASGVARDDVGRIAVRNGEQKKGRQSAPFWIYTEGTKYLCPPYAKTVRD